MYMGVNDGPNMDNKASSRQARTKGDLYVYHISTTYFIFR